MTSEAPQFESPAAPIGKLSSPGKHCFASALDAAAAAGRIAAQLNASIHRYENQRRIANNGGPLPPYAANVMAEVSDPDENNCVEISTYDYEDRFVVPK
ncbi:hypothetical protein [Mycolicibacterium lutetiense]